jgi:hypothetical protein
VTRVGLLGPGWRGCHGLPFGINVESPTNRKVEIEPSVDLARDIRDLLR